MLQTAALSILFISLLHLSGCKPVSTVKERIDYAQALSKQSELTPLIIETPPFKLQSFFRIDDPQKPLRVYIEGDGLAWISRNRLSENPTPTKPVGLELATLDKYENVLYLARPCQYIWNSQCSPEYWSNKRFSQEVITSTSTAINIVKQHFKLKSVELVGFSGGGAVAVLVAEQRTDIINITTIAGNLDHDTVNKLHNVNLMTESLNAINVAEQTAHIPQLHLVGQNDTVVPIKIAKAFLRDSGTNNNIQIQSVDASHTQGWNQVWTQLLKGKL